MTEMTEPEHVAAAAAADDPEVGLRAAASLRLLAEQLTALQVRRARELGWSWQDIAEVLGVSKQAVHQRYGRQEGRDVRALLR